MTNLERNFENDERGVRSSTLGNDMGERTSFVEQSTGRYGTSSGYDIATLQTLDLVAVLLVAVMTLAPLAAAVAGFR